MKVTVHKSIHFQGNPFIFSVEIDKALDLFAQAAGDTKQLAKEALLNRLHREKERCLAEAAQYDQAILSVIRKKV